MSRALAARRDLLGGYNSLAHNISRFDGRSVQAQIGRSVIALGQLLTLTLTSWPNLAASVLGHPAEMYCDGVRGISMFCLGSPTPTEWGRWIGIAITILVISGVLPRYVAVLQAWLAVSMSVSLSLPDGGEAVAVFSCVLLIMVMLPNDRLIAWLPRDKYEPSPQLTAIAYAGSLALCLQLAGIYFESGLAKLAVADWANGSAMFYITRDPMFGAAGAVGSTLHWFTSFPLGTALLTWGTIVLECTLAILFLCPSRLKRYALAGAIILHLGIAVSMGLWSFSLVMVGTAIAASYSLSPIRQEQNVIDGSDEVSDRWTGDHPRPAKEVVQL